MVKCEYFCDRCAKDVTKSGGQYALGEVTIGRVGLNPLKLSVCGECADEIMALARKKVAADRSQEKP